DAARAKADHSTVTQVGVDETASRRGQTYVSLFVDLERRNVLFATPGKDASTVAAFLTTGKDAQVGLSPDKTGFLLRLWSRPQGSRRRSRHRHRRQRRHVTGLLQWHRRPGAKKKSRT